MSRHAPAQDPAATCRTARPGRGKCASLLVALVALCLAPTPAIAGSRSSETAGGAGTIASGGGCAATAGVSSVGLDGLATVTVAAAPLASAARGVDVSHWDGSASMASVARSGGAFVYIKATQGRRIVDGTYPARVRAAAAAGLISGAYHFFDYRLDGAAQARFFVSTVRRLGGFTGHLPPAVDVECLRVLGRSNPGYAARQLRAFLSEVYRHTGRMAVIYTSPYMWQQVTGNDPTFGAYPLWVSCWYCDQPKLPRGWSSWTFWQVGKVGIGGVSVDGDIFRASRTVLRRGRTATPRIAGGARYARGTAARLSLRGRDGRWFRTSTDRRHWTHWHRYTSSTTLRLRATDGRQRVYLQFRDYRGTPSPVTSDRIMVDRTGPAITLGPPRFALGPIASGRLPGAIPWSASDRTSGIGAARLTRTCGDGAATVIAGRDRARAAGWLVIGTACVLTVRARDRAGNTTTVRRAEPSVVFTSDEPGDALAYAGEWPARSIPKAIGGVDHYAISAGATATLAFRGSDIAVVSTVGPARGRAEVSIDGVAMGVVDLYASANRYRTVVFARHLADPGDHVLVVRVLGTHARAASASRVDIDGFLTLDTSSFIAAE